MSGSPVEAHDRNKMRGRDVNKVAKGQQAPRPPQQSPPPSSTTSKVDTEYNRSTASNQMRRCYDSYHDYHRCIQEKGMEAQECNKIADYYKSMCPQWIEEWRIK